MKLHVWNIYKTASPEPTN